MERYWPNYEADLLKVKRISQRILNKFQRCNKKILILILLLAFFILTINNILSVLSRSLTEKETIVYDFETQLPMEKFTLKFANKQQSYRMLRGEPSECEGKDIAVMVMSTAKEASKATRMAMRKVMFDEHPNILHKFFVGYDPRLAVHDFEDEMNKYKDIVYYDGEGDYRTNYLKWYAMYQWKATYCPNIKLFIKLDDDTVVLFDRLFEWLKKDFNYVTKEVKNYALCHASKAKQPLRVRKNRWYISPKDYPLRFWPTYCVGYFVLMPNTTVDAMLEASQHINWFPMDDVLLTGATAEQAKIPIIDFKGVRQDFEWNLCNVDGLPYPFVKHNSKTAKSIQEDVQFLKDYTCDKGVFKDAELES